MQCVSELIEKLELLIRSAWRSIISNAWGHRRPWQQKEGTKKNGGICFSFVATSHLPGLGRPTSRPSATRFQVVTAAGTCGTLAHFWQERRRRRICRPLSVGPRGDGGRSPRRTETLTFPLSGSQERLFGCLKSHLFFFRRCKKKQRKAAGPCAMRRRVRLRSAGWKKKKQFSTRLTRCHSF